MPTKNPRLTITLEPTLAAQLRRLAELTGNSQSSLIAELLEGSTGVFDRLISVLEAAKVARESIKGKTALDMQEAQARVENQLGLVFEDVQSITRDLVKDVEAIRRRARKRTEGAPLAGKEPAAGGPGTGLVTPPSNRGVRSTANPKKTKVKTGADRGSV